MTALSTLVHRESAGLWKNSSQPACTTRPDESFFTCRKGTNPFPIRPSSLKRRGKSDPIDMAVKAAHGQEVQRPAGPSGSRMRTDRKCERRHQHDRISGMPWTKWQRFFGRIAKSVEATGHHGNAVSDPEDSGSGERNAFLNRTEHRKDPDAGASAGRHRPLNLSGTGAETPGAKFPPGTTRR